MAAQENSPFALSLNRAKRASRAASVRGCWFTWRRGKTRPLRSPLTAQNGRPAPLPCAVVGLRGGAGKLALCAALHYQVVATQTGTPAPAAATIIKEHQTAFQVLAAISFCHLLNDMMQSVIP